MTTAQLVLLGICAVVVFIVGVHGTLFGIRQTREIWRAAMRAAATGQVATSPRRMRRLLIGTLIVALGIGIVGWGYLIRGSSSDSGVNRYDATFPQFYFF